MNTTMPTIGVISGGNPQVIDVESRAVTLGQSGTVTETFDFEPNFVVYKNGYRSNTGDATFDSSNYWVGVFDKQNKANIARRYNGSNWGLFSDSTVDIVTFSGNSITIQGLGQINGKGVIIAMKVPASRSELP